MVVAIVKERGELGVVEEEEELLMASNPLTRRG